MSGRGSHPGQQRQREEEGHTEHCSPLKSTRTLSALVTVLAKPFTSHPPLRTPLHPTTALASLVRSANAIAPVQDALSCPRDAPLSLLPFLGPYSQMPGLGGPQAGHSPSLSVHFRQSLVHPTQQPQECPDENWMDVPSPHPSPPTGEGNSNR